jgi:hypothetical protein
VPLYAVVLGVSVVVGCLSWRRSGGSMTRYRLYTGAPVVWVLLGSAAAGALVVARSGDAELAVALFTGGLIGTGLVQVVLLRRSSASSPPDHDRTLR